MAIDRTGISSLDAGASNITYEGNEGPQAPQQMAGIGNVMKLFENYDGSFDRDTFDAMYNDFLEDNRGMKLYNFAENWLGMVKKGPIIPSNEGDMKMASAVTGGEERDIADEMWRKLDKQTQFDYGSFENYFKSGDWIEAVKQIDPGMSRGPINSIYTQKRKQQLAGGGVAGLKNRPGYFLGNLVDKIKDDLIPNEIKENPILSTFVANYLPMASPNVDKSLLQMLTK